MAWGFRKSFGFFGSLFRLNLSKSGIGASVGIPGLRFGINSRGQAYRHSSIPGTGIYEREIFSRTDTSPDDCVSFEVPHSQSVVIAALHRFAESDDSDDIHAENYGMSILSESSVITFTVGEHPRGSSVKIDYWTETSDGRKNALDMASGDLRYDLRNLLMNYRDAILRNLDALIETEPRTKLRLVQ